MQTNVVELRETEEECFSVCLLVGLPPGLLFRWLGVCPLQRPDVTENENMCNMKQCGAANADLMLVQLNLSSTAKLLCGRYNTVRLKLPGA